MTNTRPPDTKQKQRYMLIKDKLIEFLNSEEYQSNLADLSNWLMGIDEEFQRVKRYADRIKDTPEAQLREFVGKVRAKYNSKEYLDRWYKRGREPEEELYWLLLYYAEMYCEEAPQEYYTMFVGQCYWLFDDTIIQRLDGRGSFVQILTKEEKLAQMEFIP